MTRKLCLQRKEIEAACGQDLSQVILEPISITFEHFMKPKLDLRLLRGGSPLSDFRVRILGYSPPQLPVAAN